MQLTSAKVRPDLATSVQRILAAAGQPPAIMLSRRPRLVRRASRFNRVRISHPAVPRANLAHYLAAPGRSRVQGIAMVSHLLDDGSRVGC